MHDYASPQLMCCKDCKFVFTNSIPTEKEHFEYYNSSYQRNNYFSPITKARYSQILDSLEKYRKTNKILDIGCGYGFLLEVAKEKNWEVYGVEIDEESVKVCREKGINTFSGDIKDAPFDIESFDIIFSIETIEHLSYPKELVQKMNTFLRQGGVAYITTPNFNAYFRYRLKSEYDIIGYPNHLGYFARKTLANLFEECGFKTKKILTTGISLTRYRTSKGKSNQDYVSETSDDEMLRYRIEKNGTLRFFKWLLNGTLNLFKVGDNIKATFIKK